MGHLAVNTHWLFQLKDTKCTKKKIRDKNKSVAFGAVRLATKLPPLFLLHGDLCVLCVFVVNNPG
jgi:hypothetical protein